MIILPLPPSHQQEHGTADSPTPLSLMPLAARVVQRRDIETFEGQLLERMGRPNAALVREIEVDSALAQEAYQEALERQRPVVGAGRQYLRPKIHLEA